MTRSVYSRSRLYRPVRPPQQRSWTGIPGCEDQVDTFTAADGPFTGTETDLGWTVTYDDTTGGDADFVIVSNMLSIQHDGASGTFEGAIVATPVTCGDDCFLEFEYAATGYEADPNVTSEQTQYAVRATTDFTWYAGDGVVLSIAYRQYDGVYNYEAYGLSGGNPIGFSADQPGSPVGTWRMEVEGDDVRIYKDSVLLASGTDTLPTPDRHGAIFLNAASEALGGTETGPRIDTFTFGDL